jgi:hypothetical protein
MPPKRRKTPAVQCIPCSDKEGRSTLPPQDHVCSMPVGSRVGICGPANVGKSSLLKNLLLRSSPSDEGGFREIFVIHGSTLSTEYDIVDHTKVTWADCTPEFWAAKSEEHSGGPMALCVDDCAYADMTKAERANAYATVQFVCSHMGVTAFLVAHSWTALTPRLRRQCNVVCLFDNGVAGGEAIPYQARSLGMPARELSDALATCKERWDFLCIYQDPPPGRARIMRNCEHPVDNAPAEKHSV